MMIMVIGKKSGVRVIISREDDNVKGMTPLKVVTDDT